MSSVPPDNTHPITHVRVSAPARLHLGFLDLNRDSERKFGSIGLAVNSHQTIIEIVATNESTTVIKAPTPIKPKIAAIIDTFYSRLGSHISRQQRCFKLTVAEHIPEHAGLGSGTQLSLAVGAALCQFHQIIATTQDIAAALGRGVRSGIGIAAFDHGGFLIDGGLGPNSLIPPAIIHHRFPQSWRIVLIMENSRQGVHGKQELAAFKQLPNFPISDAHAICHLTLMKLLPSLLEENIDHFGQAITEIQSLIGDHFSAAQGGRYTSQSIAILLNYAMELGHYGIAQSSWGPTGCIFVNNEQSAKSLINKLDDYTHKQLSEPENYSLILARANTEGAKIELDCQ